MDENDAGAEGVVKLPSAKKLKDLIRDGKNSDTQRGEIGGSFAQQVADAVEKNGLSKTAFGMIRRLIKMSPAKLNETIQHFDDYREKLEIDRLAGIDAFAGETGKAAKAKKSKAKKGAEAEETETETAANVSRFPGRSDQAQAG